MIGFKIGGRAVSAVAGLALGAMLLGGCQTSKMAYNEMPPDRQLTSIQNNLVELKYLDRTAVGIANPATKRAIEAFQRDHNMQVDGELSPSLYVQSGLAVTRMREGAAQQVKGRSSRPATRDGATVAAMSPGEQKHAGPESCEYAQWEGTVTNVADLFACDEGRAIASLTAGRKLALKINAVEFSGGKLKVTWLTQLSLVDANTERMKKKFSWDDWMKTTQSASIYSFVCIMDGSRAAGMRKGMNVEVQAKLLSWSNTHGELACE